MLIYSSRIKVVSYLKPKHVYSPNYIPVLIRLSHDSSQRNPASESRDDSRSESSTRTAVSAIAKRGQLELDSIRRRLREQVKSLSFAVTSQFSELGGKLNKISGYEHIESLKNQVVENGKTDYFLGIDGEGGVSSFLW